MRMSFQGNHAPPSSRLATLGVATMMVLAGLLTMTVAPGVAAQSAEGPSVSGAKFLDVDSDGYLDTVDVTFQPASDHDADKLVAATIRPTDFTVVDGQSNIKPHGCRTTTTAPIHCSPAADGRTYRFHFDELERLDGDHVPDLLYNGGAFDAGGHAAKPLIAGSGTGGLAESTAATPYFLRAFGSIDSRDVLYWFTEPVHVREDPSGILTPEDEDAFCWAQGGSLGTGSIIISEVAFGTTTPTAVVTLSTDPVSTDDRATVLRARTTINGQDGSCTTSTELVDASNVAIGNEDDLKPFHTGINLVGALASIGSNEVVLAFDGPVAAPGGGPITLAIAQSAFDYDNHHSGGASNFLGVRHVEGSSRVTLVLNSPLAAGDLGVGSTAADGITLAAGGLIGAGSQVYGDDASKLVGGSHTFSGAPDPAFNEVDDRWDEVDVAPRPKEARTIDLDGDGRLDAIRVAFDQPASITGTGADAPVFSVHTLTATGQATVVPTLGVVGGLAGQCPVDNGGTPVNLPVDGAAGQVWVCLDETANLGTGVLPQLSFNGKGIEDDFDNVAVPFAGFATVDGAAPVVSAARTVDLSPATPRPDGRIDGIRITASEPVLTSSYVPAAFLVRYEETPELVHTYGVTTTITPIDNDFIIGLTERTDIVGDSDARPRVVYDPATNADALTDAAGNRVADFTFTQAQTTDGAPPRVVSVLGTVDSNTLTVTFSEPVDDGAGNPLGTGDFSYNDNNNGAGATGIINVQPAGDARWTLVLTGNLVAGDVGDGGDALEVKANAVFDVADQAVPQVTRTIATAAALQVQQVLTHDYFDYGAVAGGFDPTEDTPPRRANGRIDTLELVFNSKVDDGLDDGGTPTDPADDDCVHLNAEEWRVKVGSTVLTPLFMETYVPAPRESAAGYVLGQCRDPSGAGRDGFAVFLVFSESEAWGTDVLPVLDHLGDVNMDGEVLTGKDAGDFPVAGGIASTDKANPVLVGVSGSAGDTQITLTFSEKVRGSGSDGRVIAQDLFYRDLNTGSATGLASISSGGGGVSTVQATTNVALDGPNNAVTGSDVGDAGDAIVPFHSPGEHPSGSTLRDLAGNRIVYRDFTASPATELATRIRDNSAPFVLFYETRDTEGDGFLDRVVLTMNEPVRSAGGCVDPQQWTLTVDGDEVDVLRVTGAEALGTPCTPGGLADKLYVEFDGRAAGAGTGAVVRISYAPPTEDGDPAIEDELGNRLLPLVSQPVADKAPPVLLRAGGCPVKVIDDPQDPCHTGPVDPATVRSEAETVDAQGDGIVEALLLRFSEPVDPDTFDEDHWLVRGEAEADADKQPVVRFDFDGANVRAYLEVNVDDDPDTSVKPVLTYEPVDVDTDDDEVPGVEDFAATANKLSPTAYQGASSRLATADRAAPVIIPREDALDGKVLTLTFSEPVFSRAVGSGPPEDPDHSIGMAHLDYLNENGGSDDDDSNGRVRVTHDATVTAIVHEVEVEFNAVPSDEDIEEDRLRLLSIYDHASVQATATLASLTGESDDQQPPQPITNLRAEATAGVTDNAIVLSWTNPPPDATGRDDLDELIITIDDPADNKPAEDITQSTISARPTVPEPTAGSSQSLKVMGVESGKTYRFTIRAVDEAGNQGPVSSPVSVRVPFLDTTAPGAVNDLEVESTTGNSVTLMWTAPSDTDGEGNTVRVAGYQVRLRTTGPITDFTQGSAATFTLTPTTPAAAGQVQRATVTGLDADVQYHFAVRAVDVRPNAGGFDSASATTGAADTTPPEGTLTIVSSTHQVGVPVANDAPTFTWSGLSDPDSTITYHYALSRSSTYDVTGTEEQTALTGSTTLTTKGFTDVASGTWYFHLRGFSQGGSSDAASYQIVVAGDGAVDPLVLQAANEALQGNVTVTRDGDDNVVRWTLPDTDEDVAGVQVWRSTSPFVLLADVPADSGDFEQGAYVDEDAPENATYVVTLYFTDDPTGGKVEALADAPGYVGLTEAELSERAVPVAPPNDRNDFPGDDDGLPGWLWVLLAVGLVGIVAAVLVPMAVTRRRRGDGWDEPARWDETWSDDAWVADAAPDADVDAERDHYIECPKCDHGFEVHGEKPLETTCPNCGVRGVLR